jgi:DNA-binding beta-propeller fold protein YncE
VAGDIPRLYWSAVAQVGYANLDGSGGVIVPQPNFALGVTTLDATQQVYWIDGMGRGTIMRANADFSAATPLISLGTSASNLALDTQANLIFWTGVDNATINRASLTDGSALGTFNSPGRYPDDLAVDPLHQLLYWTTQTGEVVRSQYDGSNQTILMQLGTSLYTGACGLDLDLAAGKMYLASTNQYAVVRANLDGTGMETVLSLGAERPFGMALFGGRMYWADLDGGRIRSATLNGSDVTTILTGLRSPRQVSVMVVPEPAGLALLGLSAATLMLRRRR